MRRDLPTLAPLLRSKPTLLLTLVVAAAAADTALTALGIVQPASERLTRAVYGLEPSWLDWPMIALTYLGSGESLFAIAAILSVWALSRARRAQAVLLLGSFVLAEIAQWGIKLAIRSPRPHIHVPPSPVVLPTDYSFPSGHALASSAVLGVAVLVLWGVLPSRTLRWAMLVAAVLLIAGIGFSRIYLGVHWVNDVIGGYLYGALILLLAWMVLLLRDQDRNQTR